MRKLRTVLVAALISAGGLLWAPPASANGFCGPDEGCSPCGHEIVIDGKNSRIEFHHC